MKIVVNKELREQRHEDAIAHTIEVAKNVAERGSNKFSKEYDYDLNKMKIKNEVKKRTEGSVQVDICRGNRIYFRIIIENEN